MKERKNKMFHTHDSNYVQVQPGEPGSNTGIITTGTYQPHQHFHMCEHNVKYCAVCDVAYCTMCGKEWHTYNYNWQWYPSAIHYNWYPYTINGTPISVY